MPNFGPLCKDVIGCNVQIKGKKVIDESGNFKTPGALTASSLTSRGNTAVCGNLLADTIKPKTPLGPVLVDSELHISGNVAATGLVESGLAFHVNGLQVVTYPQLDPGNSDATLQNTSDTCNLILQVLRTHGLIVSP